MEEVVQVVVRVKPFTADELDAGESSCVTVLDDGRSLQVTPPANNAEALGDHPSSSSALSTPNSGCTTPTGRRSANTTPSSASSSSSRFLRSTPRTPLDQSARAVRKALFGGSSASSSSSARPSPFAIRSVLAHTPLSSSVQRTKKKAPVPRLQSASNEATATAPKAFTFDRVFDGGATQKDVYEAVGPLVEACLEGYNATIFAYGQTGSGKTHTMMGTRQDPGLVPRAIQQLFTLVDQRPDTLFHIQCSFVELHMNQFMDLLDPDNDPRLRRKHLPGWKPRRIDIREDCSSGSVFLVGSETLQTVVTSYEEAIGLVERGHRTRTVASTCSNSKSSRSHAIITFQVESRDAANKEAAVTVGKLHMVDLAGSERLSKSLAEGETKKETMSINSSLTALGDVLSALSSQKGGLIPYRNNKLTRFLQDSLGGNSKTFFVINVQPAVSHWRETMMSLQYGQRAKLIRNCVSVNRDLVGSSDLQALNTEIENLKNRLAQRTQQYEEIRKQQSLVGRENKELKERLEALSRLNMEEKEALEHQMHAVIHSKEGEMAEQRHAFLSLQAYLDERVKKTHDLKVKLALEEGELEELRQKHKSQQHEITRLKAEKKVALQRNQKLLKKLETVRLLWEEDRNNIRTQVLNLETQLQQERMQILELRQQLDLAKNSKLAEKENEEEKETTITEAELELKKQKRLAKDAQQKVRIVLSELEKQKNLTQEQDQLLEEQCARITELEKELKQRGMESKTDKRTIQQLQKEIELLRQQQSNLKSNGFEEEEEEETVVAKKRTSRKRRTIDEDDYVGEGEEKRGTKKKSDKTNATSGRVRKRSKKQEQPEEQIEEEKEKEVGVATTTKKKQQRSNTSNGPKRLRGKRQLISETEFIDNDASEPSLEPSYSSSSTQTQTNKPSPTNNTTNKKSFFASSASATRFGGLTTPSSSSASSSSAASVLMSGMMGPMTRALLKKRGSRPLSSVNSNKSGSLSGASSSISELVKVGQFRPPQLLNNNNKLKEKENVL